MKGIFWNTGGLGDLGKHNTISNLVKSHRLDFLALLETGKSSFPLSFLRHLAGGMDYLWHTMAPKGRSVECFWVSTFQFLTSEQFSKEPLLKVSFKK
jgi:hypothetical protein